MKQNQLKSRKPKIFIAVMIAIITIVGALFIYSYLKDKTNLGINKTFTYYDFRFPFKFSEDQINRSLMNDELITVKNVKQEWPDSVNSMALQDGWKLLDSILYNDGGSSAYRYFKSKDVPAVEIFYHWDALKGNYESVTVRFIHPAKIGSWLLKIRSDKLFAKGEKLNVESLMQCDGIIAETHPGFTECIKK